MKPYIISHMMSTVDGRLRAERYSLPFDSKSVDDLVKHYFDIMPQLEGQAVILGRNTIQAHYHPKTFDHRQLPTATDFAPFVGNRGSENPIVVIDPKGKVLYEIDQKKDDTFIAVLGEWVSQAYLEDLRKKKISYVFAGADGHDMAQAMETLNKEFGMSRILVGGGGVVNGSFLKAGLIDELSLTIYPGVDGLAGSPTIFEYPGKDDEEPAKGQSMELVSVERLPDGVIWLRYRLHKR